jgi:8-oxo-dGTP pyrophosphatase MutT (NUDIX family)
MTTTSTAPSLPPAALRALWRRIPYGVVLPDGRSVDVRVGERAPDVDAALAALSPGCRAWAVVTAFNPDAQSASDDDNARAHAALSAELAARALPCLRSTGGRGDDATWAPEPGFVIGGLDLVDAHALARRFGQAAFLYARVGAPVALVVVRPAAFDAPRSIETVAWIDVDDVGRSRMVRPRGKALFFMPGGKKEPGEDDVAALVRELREELAVDVDEDSVVARFVVEERAFGPVEPTVVRMACYAARVRGVPTPSSEIDTQDFVAVDEGHRVPPAGRAVLANLRDER